MKDPRIAVKLLPQELKAVLDVVNEAMRKDPPEALANAETVLDLALAGWEERQ